MYLLYWWIFHANVCANLFVLGDFNIYHKDWLTYFSGTDRLNRILLESFYISWTYPDG